MSRHRDFRNCDYDDFDDDDDDDLYGSVPNSYDSMSEYRPDPDEKISFGSYLDLPESPSSKRFGSKLPEDHEILNPCLDELEAILEDKYSTAQLIDALRKNDYSVQDTISWFLDEDDEDDDPFQFDDERARFSSRTAHPSASMFASFNNNNNNNNHNNIDETQEQQQQSPNNNNNTTTTSSSGSGSHTVSSKDGKDTNDHTDVAIIHHHHHHNKKHAHNQSLSPNTEHLLLHTNNDNTITSNNNNNKNNSNSSSSSSGGIGVPQRFPSALAEILCNELLHGNDFIKKHTDYFNYTVGGGNSPTRSCFRAVFESMSVFAHPLPVLDDADDLYAYDFRDPSPDDIVLTKQNKVFNQQKGDKSKTVTPAPKPQEVKPFKPIVKGGNNNKNNNNNSNKSNTPKAMPVKAVQQQQQQASSSALSQSKESIQPPVAGGVGNESVTIVQKPKKLIRQMPQDVRSKIIESVNASTEKPHLNLVVVGHVDVGKSTTMGHLLFQIGQIDKKLMHKYKQEAQRGGKSSFAYAWVLDENEEERQRGVTIDVGVNYFETESKRVTLLDAPGHKDFVSNMITGAAQADAAVLVIDGGGAEFETGLSDDGQTKEHTVLVRSLGVEQLIVAINKLDLVAWSHERYLEIVDKMGTFLKLVGFKPRNVRFVPVSGFTGENLVTKSDEKLCCWYGGDTLLEAIDHFTKPVREIEGPFRMCITDVYKSMSLGQTIAGKVESGIVGVGDNLLIIPGYEICTVKGLEVHDKSAKYAVAGDNVCLGVTGVDANLLTVGHFVCDPQKPIPYTNRFLAKIITFSLKYPITKGSPITIQYQNVAEVGVIKRLKQTLNKTTGVVLQENPRTVGDSAAALVLIESQRPICVDLFSNSKQFGRFTLRDKGQTIATGVITKLLKRKVIAANK